MSLDSINMQFGGQTPLDYAYGSTDSSNREEASYPIRQEIIALLRSKGGKVNCYDANGRWVGRGNGEI